MSTESPYSDSVLCQLENGLVLLTWREDGRYGRALYGLGRVQQADWAGPPQQVGLRVPPIVNPAQSVRRKWGVGGRSKSDDFGAGVWV